LLYNQLRLFQEKEYEEKSFQFKEVLIEIDRNGLIESTIAENIGKFDFIRVGKEFFIETREEFDEVEKESFILMANLSNFLAKHIDFMHDFGVDIRRQVKHQNIEELGKFRKKILHADIEHSID